MALVVSLNENNLINNKSKDLLNYIYKIKPKIIIICTQNSLYGTDKHFQHYINKKLSEKNYQILYKSGKKNIIGLFPRQISRIRIYIPLFSSGINLNVQIIEEVINKNYILLRLKINNKIYCIININNIKLSELIVGYYDYIYICGVTDSITNLKNSNFESDSELNFINFKNFISTLTNISYNQNFRNSNASTSSTLTNITNITNQNGGLIFGKSKNLINNNNNNICVSSEKANKVANMIGDPGKYNLTNNTPHSSNYVPYYNIMKYMFILDGRIDMFICLFHGLYTDKSFNQVQNYGNKKIQNNYINRIVFLDNFLEYLNYYKSKYGLNKKLQVDNLIKIINSIKDQLLSSYERTFIITNIAVNNVYKDFYVKNNDKYLYYLTLYSDIFLIKK
jgi:hypothetical protein